MGQTITSHAGSTPYHRVGTPRFQTEADARAQHSSGELWGKAAKWSSLLAVKAYRGPLPAGRDGIEFVTLAAPSPGSHPHDVFWYENTLGVQRRQRNGEDFACILITVMKARYPGFQVP